MFWCVGLYESDEENSYNAFEKDIAVVHFFFQVYSYHMLCLKGLGHKMD
jgi:hypothetical protein